MYWIVIINKKIYLINKKVVIKVYLDLEFDKEVFYYIINYMFLVKIDIVWRRLLTYNLYLGEEIIIFNVNKKKVKNNIYIKINLL